MELRLVLSGGAVRGVAHIGVIKALEELGFKITSISGVSAGALVGVFYSAGYKPEEMLSLVKSSDWLYYIRPRLPKLGLFSLSKAVKFLESALPYRSIEELPLKTYLCALDIKSGETLYFDRGELFPVLLGSCALPGIFEPIKYRDYLLVDGGITNNLPVEPLLKEEGLLVGVDVNPKERVEKVGNMVYLLMRSFLLAVRSNVDKRKELCEVLVEPPLHNYGLFNIRRAKEIYELGYRSALDILKRHVR